MRLPPTTPHRWEKTEKHEGQHEGQDHEEYEEEGLQANEEIVARRIGAAGGCEGKKVRCAASFSDTRRSSFQWGGGDNFILHNERRSLCVCVGGLLSSRKWRSIDLG